MQATSTDSQDDTFALVLATSSDAAVMQPLNVHLWNIELLLLLILTLVFGFIVHVLLRGLFSKLSGKDK